MAALSVQSVPANGNPALLTYTTAAATDNFANDGETFLAIKFGTAATAAEIVTILGVPDPYGRDGSEVVDGTVADVVYIAGPFDQRAWNNGSIVELTAAGTLGATRIQYAAFKKA